MNENDNQRPDDNGDNHLENDQPVIYDSPNDLPYDNNSIIFNGGHTNDIEALVGELDTKNIRLVKKPKRKFIEDKPSDLMRFAQLSLDDINDLTNSENISTWLYLIGTQLRSSIVERHIELLELSVNENNSDHIVMNKRNLITSYKILLAIYQATYKFMEEPFNRIYIKSSLLYDQEVAKAKKEAEAESSATQSDGTVVEKEMLSNEYRYGEHWETPTRTNLKELRDAMRNAKYQLQSCLASEIVKQHVPELLQYEEEVSQLKLY